MSIDREKFCRGCALYEQPPPCNYLIMLENGETCPCNECLIKTTCEEGCEKFKTYSYKSDEEVFLRAWNLQEIEELDMSEHKGVEK